MVRGVWGLGGRSARLLWCGRRGHRSLPDQGPPCSLLLLERELGQDKHDSAGLSPDQSPSVGGNMRRGEVWAHVLTCLECPITLCPAFYLGVEADEKGHRRKGLLFYCS